jgi:hypothetical protein
MFTMSIIVIKEGIMVVVMNDLDYRVQDVAFEANVFNRYGTFNCIAQKNLEDPSYVYLHCDLLDGIALTTIILKVKSLHIEMHINTFWQKCMYVTMKNFGIGPKSKRGFEKGDMLIIKKYNP